MLREEGRVVALDGEIALVTSQRKKACGSCAGEASCSTLSLGAGKKEMSIRAINRAGAQVGERVVVEISEAVFLKAAGLLFGLPSLALVVAGVGVRGLLLEMGYQDAAEGFGALAGLAAMALTFLSLRRFNHGMENQLRHLPVITEVMG
ncbi:MAG: SoxR reducing system RseC family protein [Magnetococcales bacterium]|nr:SoxR reducing system RseC family protein [Magnetococcales bacterium]